MRVNLKRLLAGKEVVAFADPDLDAIKPVHKPNPLDRSCSKAETLSLQFKRWRKEVTMTKHAECELFFCKPIWFYQVSASCGFAG